MKNNKTIHQSKGAIVNQTRKSTTGGLIEIMPTVPLTVGFVFRKMI